MASVVGYVRDTASAALHADLLHRVLWTYLYLMIGLAVVAAPIVLLLPRIKALVAEYQPRIKRWASGLLTAWTPTLKIIGLVLVVLAGPLVLSYKYESTDFSDESHYFLSGGPVHYLKPGGEPPFTVNVVVQWVRVRDAPKFDLPFTPSARWGLPGGRGGRTANVSVTEARVTPYGVVADAYTASLEIVDLLVSVPSIQAPWATLDIRLLWNVTSSDTAKQIDASSSSPSSSYEDCSVYMEVSVDVNGDDRLPSGGRKCEAMRPRSYATWEKFAHSQPVSGFLSFSQCTQDLSTRHFAAWAPQSNANCGSPMTLPPLANASPYSGKSSSASPAADAAKQAADAAAADAAGNTKNVGPSTNVTSFHFEFDPRMPSSKVETASTDWWQVLLWIGTCINMCATISVWSGPGNNNNTDKAKQDAKDVSASSSRDASASGDKAGSSSSSSSSSSSGRTVPEAPSFGFAASPVGAGAASSATTTDSNKDIHPAAPSFGYGADKAKAL